jgi:hypothetical protein
MGADNWAICPRCKRRHEKQAEKMRLEADNAYGTVSVDDWKALDDAAIKAAEPFTAATFREDYELGVVGPEFYARYSGNCSECGLTHKFEVDQPVAGVED